MHMLDRVQAELELGVPEKQVSEVFEGQQATSYVDTNIHFEQGKTPCITPILDFYFELISLY
jgi:hypothetical protein